MTFGRSLGSLLLVALAALGAACSSDAEEGGGGQDGGQGGDCPSALGCECPYGEFTKNECGGYVCTCPAQCQEDTECGDAEYCSLLDCGEKSGGYCLGGVPDEACSEPAPICSCDGELYSDSCALRAAHASPTAAPTSDCAVEKVRCDDDLACYAATQFCVKFADGYSYCDNFSRYEACDGTSCDCVASGFSESCACAANEVGLFVMECH